MNPIQLFLLIYIPLIIIILIIKYSSGDLATFQDRMQIFRGIVMLGFVGVLLLLAYKVADFFLFSNPFL